LLYDRIERHILNFWAWVEIEYLVIMRREHLNYSAINIIGELSWNVWNSVAKITWQALNTTAVDKILYDYRVRSNNRRNEFKI